jgi:hypothetical protein
VAGKGDVDQVVQGEGQSRTRCESIQAGGARAQQLFARKC